MKSGLTETARVTAPLAEDNPLLKLSKQQAWPGKLSS